MCNGRAGRVQVLDVAYVRGPPFPGLVEARRWGDSAWLCGWTEPTSRTAHAANTLVSDMDAPRAPRARLTTPLGLSAEPVLDASPNAVIAVDARGRIVYASPRVREAFGWSPEELLGEPVERIVPARLAEP